MNQKKEHLTQEGYDSFVAELERLKNVDRIKNLEDLKEARANAYAATEWVDFANKYMRHDIGKAIDEA